MLAAAIALTTISTIKNPSCLRFTQDGQVVTVPYQASMNLKEITIEAWIKVDPSAKERFFNYILCRNYANLGYGVALNGYNPKVFSQSTQTKVVYDQWTHIALVRSNKANKFYVNGELTNASESGGYLKPFEHKILIGTSDMTGEPGGQPTSFRGEIAELRIWSYPRTQGEIQTTMKRYLRGNEKGLYAYFPALEGDGQIVHDYTGHIISGCMGDSYEPDPNDAEWGEGIKLEGKMPRMRPRR